MEKQACCTNKKLTGTLSSKAGNEAVRSIGQPWVTGTLTTAAGQVPLISTKLSFKDHLGSWKCRWTFGRHAYSVSPGLYAVGSPVPESPVLVTANYKMTFDRLRQELTGTDAWILVLDTRGINVWCAAGKGTFGTAELIRKIRAVKLDQVVSHKTIILPQLGATGVSAHEVTQASGFRVIYGPVRASDIPAFLKNGLQATPDMRRVRFNTLDRLVLTPAELVFTFKPAVIIFGILFILNTIGFGHYGLPELAGLAGALLTGCVLTPVLLPVIPGRAFSFKGALTGLLWAAGVAWFMLATDQSAAIWLKSAAFILVLPAISAFLAMNFTGSTTYTSPSGVNKEMSIALPIMLVSAALGIILLLASDVVQMIL